MAQLSSEEKETSPVNQLKNRIDFLKQSLNDLFEVFQTQMQITRDGLFAISTVIETEENTDDLAAFVRRAIRGYPKLKRTIKQLGSDTQPMYSNPKIVYFVFGKRFYLTL